MSKIPIAISYDFDGTFAPGNMQSHTLLPGLNVSNESIFWDEVNNIGKKKMIWMKFSIPIVAKKSILIYQTIKDPSLSQT
jgi:hypothetical protein